MVASPTVTIHTHVNIAVSWHQLTGGLRRRWANKSLNTFTEAIDAFRTAMSFRFFDWLTFNRAYLLLIKANLGLIFV